MCFIIWNRLYKFIVHNFQVLVGAPLLLACLPKLEPTGVAVGDGVELQCGLLTIYSASSHRDRD